MTNCTLVTGGSKGIGRAIVERLHARKQAVVYLSRSPGEPLDNCTHVATDLNNLEQTEKHINDVMSSFGISNVICNAGCGQFGSLENFSPQQIKNSIQLNLISPLLIARMLLPTLKAQPRSNLIFIGSESGLQGGRYGSVYSAAKFGLRGATQALKHECANANCHVGIVNPGLVRTDFFSSLSFEPGKEADMALQAKDVANAVLTLIDSPDHAIIDEINLSPIKHVVTKKPQK